MVWFLLFLSVLLFAMVLVMGYQLIRLAKFIMYFEDNHSVAIEEYYEAVDALLAAETHIEAILKMPIFFETESIREVVQKGKDEAAMARLIVRKCAEGFIARIREKEIVYEEVDDEQEAFRQPLTTTDEEEIYQAISPGPPFKPLRERPFINR